MYRTNIKNKKSGPFNSEMVVSMRIFNQKDIKKVKQVSGNFSFAHGDPIHIGDPIEIGIKKYFEKGTFIHKDSDESFILICKNQTCSEKLKSLEQVKEYINAKSI